MRTSGWFHPECPNLLILVGKKSEKKYKKWHGFQAKLFFVLPKFDQINIFQKFKRNLVKEGLNQQKM
jgi:hypothetical protein